MSHTSLAKDDKYGDASCSVFYLLYILKARYSFRTGHVREVSVITLSVLHVQALHAHLAIQARRLW